MVPAAAACKPTLPGRAKPAGLPALPPRFWRSIPDERPARTLLGRLQSSKGKKTNHRPGLAPPLKAPAGPYAAGKPIFAACSTPLAGDPLDQLGGPFRPLCNAAMVCWSRLRKPEPLDPGTAPWRQGEGCCGLPVPTHLLGVLRRSSRRSFAAVMPASAPGRDISSQSVETPPGGECRAVNNQSRQVEPPAWPACSAAPSIPTRSLATACDLQTLIDETSVQPRCSWPGWPGLVLKILG